MHILIVDSSLPTASTLTEWLSSAPGRDSITCLQDPPPPLLAHLQGLLPRPPGPAAPAKRALSPRLSAVEAQLLRGMPNKLIARQLGLSDHTIKEYVSNVLAHHGVNNRLQLLLQSRPG